MIFFSSSLSSLSSSSSWRGTIKSHNFLLCLIYYHIASISILLFLPSSKAFSQTITATTCPKTSIKGWDYARQQQANQNRRSTSSTRRYSIFYDDFEDFTTNTDNKEGNEDVVVGNDNNSNNSPDDEDDISLASSLKARQNVLHNEKQQLHKQHKEQKEVETVENERLKHNWREANCVSTVRLSLEDDWIRRIAIDLYPLVVCGTSRGNLYLGDLDSGDEIDCIESVHASTGDLAELLTFDNDDDDSSNKNEKSDSNSNTVVPLGLSNCLQALYDGHDGNGPFAIAVKNDLIVSSGREGGIHACTIVGKEMDVPNSSSSSSSNSNGRSSGRGRGFDTTTKQTKLKLQREGKFRGLEEAATPFDTTKESNTNNKNRSQSPAPLITSLKFDDRGTLWAGGYDGTLRGYHHEELDVDDRPLMLRQKHPDYEIDVGSPIIDMSIQEETGVIVVTTETEGVFVYSLDMDVRSSGEDSDGRDRGRACLLHVNPFAGRGSYLTKEGNRGQKQFCRTAMIVRNNDNDDDNNNNSTDITNKSNTNTNTNIINEITDKDIGKTTQTLIVGGSFGHMYQFTIRLYGDTTTFATTTTSDDIPPPPIAVSSISAESMQKFRPKHMGPIVSLASPSPGLFVTASQDGTMRVWDCSNNDGNDTNDINTRVEKALEVVVEDDEEDDDDDGVEVEKDEGKEGDFRSRLRAARKRKKKNNNPKVLYALSGYKVWLGSIFANGSKLVSDGADNSIIVHSFDSNEEEILRSQQEDDEDEKGDEDPFSAFS